MITMRSTLHKYPRLQSTQWITVQSLIKSYEIFPVLCLCMKATTDKQHILPVLNAVYVLACVQCLACMIVTMTVKMMMNPICRDAARKVATRSTVSQLGLEQQKCIQFADKEVVKDTDPASREVETR